MRTTVVAVTLGLVAALVGAGGLPARADDSVASLGAGGIVLQKTDAIAILSEELFVSAQTVRVRFAFRNETQESIESLVAFALPDIKFADYAKHANLVPAPADPLNFIWFSAAADGRAVRPRVDARALLAGQDVTSQLRDYDVPISFFQPDFKTRLRSLPASVHRELVARGLLSADKIYGIFEPYWTVRTRFYWHQRFLPDRTVAVEHSYRPVLGIDPNFSLGHLQRQVRERYCIDETARGALARLAQKVPYGNAMARTVDYLLTTGGNWRGGNIGDFRLKVSTESPSEVLATCLAGLRKTGPTTYEAERKNFVPRKDLHILFVGEQSLMAE